MAKLFYNSILLLLLLLITTRVDFTLCSCLPDTVGTCGCCKTSTTQCLIIPSSIMPSFPLYEKYICVSKISVLNLSLNQCNCTSKEPALCICSNSYTKVYPLYPSCCSFTECLIKDIKVKDQQKIRERVCKKAVRFTGRCSEKYVRRYYYDWNTNRCQSFIYSGCSINRLTFITQDFCEQVCQI